jgi:hypothetical protein
MVGDLVKIGLKASNAFSEKAERRPGYDLIIRHRQGIKLKLDQKKRPRGKDGNLEIQVLLDT